jgi:hypothetical protein
MRFLSYAYRFLSNFVFLMLAYFSLNFMEKYQQRAVVAILVLLYAAMRRHQRCVRSISSSGSSGSNSRRAVLPAWSGMVRPHPPRASRSSPTSARCVVTGK